ncbi:MAG: cob(I)yrinic acid a,c-diamide adenosyltransferase [Janthinobacterium lividum]
MGNRLSRITTRTGDDGTTGLGDGRRVPKDAARVIALGDVDELNSQLGVLLAEALPDALRATLAQIQHDLFDLGGELAIPGRVAIDETQVARLDGEIAAYNANLPPLVEFILPGGSRAAALAHVARTVCRRAERAVITLAGDEDVGEGARLYLNRLSDLLFVLSREINRQAGVADVCWRSPRLRAAAEAQD